MLYCLTSSTQHLRKLFVNRGVSVIHYLEERLAGGGYRFQLTEDVRHQPVTLVASILPDPVTFFELLAVHRLLRENKTRPPELIIPYFGYTRQDHDQIPGALALGLMLAELIRNLNSSRIAVIEPHHEEMIQALGSTAEIIDLALLFASHIAKDASMDIVIAADEDAKKRAERMAKALSEQTETLVEYGWMQKRRTDRGKVQMERIEGSVFGKHVLLVDDLFETGETIREAVKCITEKGALSIRAAVAHGIFTEQVLDQLQKTPLQRLFVSNSIAQSRHPLIEIIDVTKRMLFYG